MVTIHANMLNKIKKFVNDSFNMSANDNGTKHFEQTVYWVKEIKPNPDEPTLIAAYAHDIARAFRKETTQQTFKNKEFNDSEILTQHQEQGATIISDFLQKEDYNEEAIKRVHNMILHHEVGGDEDSDLIKDADSVSYLEINAVKHVKLADNLGREKIGNKIKWMYDRITSPKAKELAKPFYEKAIQKLDLV